MPNSAIHHITQDKRCAPRFATYKSSVMIRDDEEIYTTIVNISASGIGFLSAVPLQVGDLVDIVCSVEQFCSLTQEVIDTTIALPIEIARIVEEDGEFMVGAKVHQVTFEFRQMLKKLADLHTEFGTIKTHDPDYHPGMNPES
ncbi:PilZ domain-containing protein [Thiomicrorhabdus cannonii]|uniref:PilZ domain-containing protein n=1 Tax=Thiomicrorhabdus cannonii TaxID=2748011 RepID=UPI0015C03CC5|nr:PilZ domain-containing protein [Thiomicrorhabdus cannonii]